MRCLTGASLGVCSEVEREVIERYHTRTADVLLEIGGMNKNGVWAPACVNHCYAQFFLYSSEFYRVPRGSDFTMILAVSEWF